MGPVKLLPDLYSGILLALKFNGIRGLVGAQTYTLVRDTTLQSYFEHLDSMKLVDGVDYKWMSSEQKLIFLATIQKSFSGILMNLTS